MSKGWSVGLATFKEGPGTMQPKATLKAVPLIASNTQPKKLLFTRYLVQPNKLMAIESQKEKDLRHDRSEMCQKVGQLDKPPLKRDPALCNQKPLQKQFL